MASNVDKNPKKPIVKIASLALVVTILSSGIELCREKLSGYESPIVVTEEERNSFYDYNNLKSNTIIKPSKNVDYNITSSVLDKIEILDLNLNRVDGLSCISKYPNLRHLNLSNVANLTKEDIDYINDSNVSCISFANELDGVLFLDYLDFLNPKCSVDNIEQYKHLDFYLNGIITSLDLDNLTNWEKLVKISEYIISKIDYDKEISNIADKNKLSKEEDLIVKKYNNYRLSSVVNGEIFAKKSGICVNYASLLTALSHKAGLNVSCVEGYSKTTKIGHAWNLIKIDNDNFYIDLTFDDSDSILALAIDGYKASKKDSIMNNTCKEDIKNIILRDVESYDTRYRKNKNSIKEVNYINEGKENKLIFDGNLWYTGPLFIGIFNGTVYVLIKKYTKDLKGKVKKMKF